MKSCRFVLLAALFAATVSSEAHEQTRNIAVEQIRLAEAKAAADAIDAETLRKLPKCEVSINVVEFGSKDPVPANIRVLDAETGKAIPIADEIHRANNWYSIDAGATVTLPQIKLMVEAIRGPETELTTKSLVLAGKAKASIELPINRFYDAEFRGLRSGNTHLHLMKLTHAEALRYLQLVPQCDDLDLVFLSHLRRIPDERTYITNQIVEDSFAGGSLKRLSQHGALYSNGQEHRHNFGAGGEGFGHVMLLDIQKLIRPVSIGPGIMRSGTDSVPLQHGIKEARKDKATVVWCHNAFGHEDLPNWLAGLVHAQNIWDGSQTGTYADSFYRYLNLGIKVPFSTGTDWFVYDFARVYVPMDGELTSEAWLKQLRDGRSFITNGPFLELIAERGVVGDTISLPGPGRLTFMAKGMGRLNFGGLEMIYNGKVVGRASSTREGGYYFTDKQFSVNLPEPGWVALRVPLDARDNEFGRRLFAHTSPIYIEMNNKSIFKHSVAEEMLKEIDGSIKKIEDQAKFANAKERAAVMQVYSDATRKLDAMLKAAGPKPKARKKKEED